MATPRELLDRLDTRHDELIRKLDELNAEIEATLAQFTKSRATVSPAQGVADDVPAGAVSTSDVMPRCKVSLRRAA